jgi:predicted nucleic acid-binding protein
MQNLVCLDSHILVWGIKNQSEPSQKPMIEKARDFLEMLDEKKIQVLIPTVVIAEILIPEPIENQIKILNILTKNFVIGDLNVAIAQKFAQLFASNKDLNTLLKEQEKLRKDKMKFDQVIVATALQYGANCIYSYDKHVKSFAKDKIEVNELPDIFKQKKLFQ